MTETFEKLQVNLKHFKDANKRLNEALAQPYNEFIRDSVIQRFEFTFELAWKTLKLALLNEGIQEGTPRLVLEAGFKAGFVEDLGIWRAMLQGRNATSHVYNESDATAIYNQIKDYPPYFELLEKALTDIK